MSKWKITTMTEFGDFVAWADTEDRAQEFTEWQKRRGGWDCKIEEVAEND